MNKTPWLVCSLIALSSAVAFASGTPGEKVIYGDDDRLDLYQVTNSRDLDLAASTVVLIENSKLTRNGEKFDIRADEFGREFGLCESEPFRTQPSGGFCSGALVGEDLLITAGHCIRSTNDCATTKFVFGYAVTQEGVFPTSAPANDVVGCKEIITRKQEGFGADYALIRLDRKITHRRPLRINRAKDLKAGDLIGVIGHPSGLPVKVAFGKSTVRDVNRSGYFVASLDTYGGNSGSAVFNTTTGLIEGILVRGETDFVYSPQGCRKSNVCSESGCRGEDVTKIDELAALIPEVGSQTEPMPPREEPMPPRRTDPTSKWPSAAPLARQ